MEQNSFKVAEIEISYTPDYKITDRPKLNTSKQAYALLIQHWNHNKIQFVEEFKIILLNRKNRVLGIIDLSSDGIAGVVVDSKIVFSAALTACASAIILVHNHPSGEVKPSTYDTSLTDRLRQGGKILDIPVLDHLIISKYGYYSFADEGLL